MIAPQRPPQTTVAVDSYSPLCHYSFVKEPDAFRVNSELGTGKAEPTATPHEPPRPFAPTSAFPVPRWTGGADGIRTHGLLVANQALSQLSYGPEKAFRISVFGLAIRNRAGGPRWIRTTDLALIRGAL